MTVNQIAAIHFEGRKQTAHKRVQRLKSSKLIRERPRQPNEPSILFLAFKGFEFLRKQKELTHLPELPWAVFSRRVQVSEWSLRHELAVLDTKAALLPAVNATGRHWVSEFSTWPRLHEFHTDLSDDGGGSHPHKRILTKPDGFFRVVDTATLSTESFFIEVDRSTETLDTLVRKALAYSAHYKCGGFAKQLGLAPGDYARVPFRVLLIFKNDERRNNVAERLLQTTPPILTQMWLSTLEDVEADPLGEIWMRPLDYREVILGSEFDPSSGERAEAVYRRQAEREHLVATRVKRQTLLDGLVASRVHPHPPSRS